MQREIKSGYRKARKQHRTDLRICFGFANYQDGIRISDLNDIGMTQEEVDQVMEADRRNFVIQPGEEYYYQVGVYEGEIYTFKAPKGIHEICCKHHLYDED